MGVVPRNRRRTKGMPELVRERIRAAQCLNNLEWVEGEIRNRLQQLDLAEVPALRLYADIQLRKMAKVMPDLKAVELSGNVTVTEFRLRANP